jgi:hypothetical protein
MVRERVCVWEIERKGKEDEKGPVAYIYPYTPNIGVQSGA